jgi:hypothetical protein
MRLQTVIASFMVGCACGPPSADLDAGHDAGAMKLDGGVDGGAPDGGPDAGGATDAGATDAGPMDAGLNDAGAADGSVDAGPMDAGLADAGAADAGPVDGGARVDAGWFASQSALPLSTPPAVVGQGDFNGDGRPDLVVGYTSTAPTAVIYWGQGSGAFTLGPTSSLYLPATTVGLTELQATDLNGDGFTDVVFVGVRKVGYALARADGGGLGPPVEIAPSNSWAGLVVGDFNGDGRPDVKVSIAGMFGSALAFFNLGDGGFASSGWLTPLPLFSAAGDFDLDGGDDLAMLFSDVGVSSRVYLGQTDGGIASGAPTPVTCAPTNIAVGDVSGDGCADLLVGCTSPAVIPFWSDCRGGLLAQTPVTLTDPPYYAMRLGDLNADGRLDLVTLGPTGAVEVRLASSDGGFIKVADQQMPLSPSQLILADVNGDGRSDVITVGTGVVVSLSR